MVYSLGIPTSQNARTSQKKNPLSLGLLQPNFAMLWGHTHTTQNRTHSTKSHTSYHPSKGICRTCAEICIFREEGKVIIPSSVFLGQLAYKLAASFSEAFFLESVLSVTLNSAPLFSVVPPTHSHTFCDPVYASSLPSLRAQPITFIQTRFRMSEAYWSSKFSPNSPLPH